MEKENLENRAEEALVYAYLSTASLVVCFSVALIMLWSPSAAGVDFDRPASMFMPIPAIT